MNEQCLACKLRLSSLNFPEFLTAECRVSIYFNRKMYLREADRMDETILV